MVCDQEIDSTVRPICCWDVCNKRLGTNKPDHPSSIDGLNSNNRMALCKKKILPVHRHQRPLQRSEEGLSGICNIFHGTGYVFNRVRSIVCAATILISLNSFALTSHQIFGKAEPHLALLDSVITKYWPDAPCREFIAGQIEQETCANLKKCWNSNTELKTKREYGFGLGQITIAYRKNGSVRFNNFDEAKRRYEELSDWQWDDRYNTKYQLIFIVMECKLNFKKYGNRFVTDIQKWAAALVTYNAGSGAVLTRLKVCKVTPGCDCTTWFGGLDQVHSKEEEVLLYGRMLYLRRNDYPYNIIYIRSQKYADAVDKVVHKH